MRDTRIRWANDTWNPMVGCTKVSPGCDHCYAETIALKFRGTAFPNGFNPTFKPEKLGDPARWKAPRRIFVNSMSDVHHESFTIDEIDRVYDAMASTDRHDYLVLTKRPQRMARYLLGAAAWGVVGHEIKCSLDGGWLERRGLDRVPPQIWLGTSIESDRYTFRANHLRRIPVDVRFLSCEPLLEALPSLDLSGIGWVIAGGESGPGFRPMDHAWARDLRDRCMWPLPGASRGIAFYFKQSAAFRTEMGVELDGRRWEEYPFPHPATGLPRRLGVYVDDDGRPEAARRPAPEGRAAAQTLDLRA